MGFFPDVLLFNGACGEEIGQTVAGRLSYLKAGEGVEMEKESIKDLVDRIIADSKVTRAEQKVLNEAILKDGKIDPEEREQIDRLLEMIYRGEIEAVP